MRSQKPTKAAIENVILSALSEKDCYGYELSKALSEHFGDYEIKQPTLYNHLKRLEAKGYIRYYWGEESLGGRRKYYTATPAGKQALSGKTQKAKIENEVVTDFDINDQIDITDENHEHDIEQINDDKYYIDFNLQPKYKEKHIENFTITEQMNFQMQLDNIAAKKGVEGDYIDVGFDSHEDYIDEADDYSALSTSMPNMQQPVYNCKPSKSAAEFFAEFEEKIKQRSIYKPVAEEEHKDEQNYKHVMTSLLGDQIKEKSSIDKQAPAVADQSDNAKGPATLDALAEQFAQKNIRLSFYNHETASYEPQAMLYKSKINCAVSWLTYFAFAFMTMLVWVLYRNNLQFLTAAKFLIGGVTVPLLFSIIYAINPTRKKKPVFRFKYHFINAWMTFVLVVIMIFAVNVLIMKIVFTDTTAVLTQVVIPILAALSMPIAVLIYKLIFKKMLV